MMLLLPPLVVSALLRRLLPLAVLALPRRLLVLGPLRPLLRLRPVVPPLLLPHPLLAVPLRLLPLLPLPLEAEATAVACSRPFVVVLT